MELACQTWKSQNTETKVVLLHGMGGTGRLWRPIAAGLEDQFTILAPDQRGHGKSQTKQSSYTPIDYGNDLVETLTARNFHPAWLVGHSMGVRTACACAHLNPKLVQGLVLIDLGFEGPAGGGLGKNLRTFLKNLPLKFESREQAKNWLFKDTPDQSISQYLLAVSETNPDTHQTTFPFDKNALIQTIESVQGFSLKLWIESFGEKNLPILILRGENSKVFSKQEFEKEKKYFSKFKTIHFDEVKNATHGLPFEQRAIFSKKLIEFMKLNSA